MKEGFCSGEKSAMERESVVARDFLGLNSGRNLSGDSQQMLKPHLKDKVCLGNMSLHWPYSNKAAALQQFISFKSLQDGSKKSSCDKLTSSAFHPISTADAFDLNNRSTIGSQRTLYVDPSTRDVTDSGIYHFGQNSGVSHINFSPQTFHERGAQGYNIQEGGMFPCSNYSVSVSNGGFPAYFNGQQATATSLLAKQFQGIPQPGQNSFMPILGASVSTPKPGIASSVPEKSTIAQLTIFYGGTVNVYDDVPADKAQAIMFLAGNGNSSSGKAPSPQPESSTISLSVSSDGNAKHVTSLCPNALNTLSVTNPQAYPHNSQTTVQSQTNLSTAIMPTTGDPETKQSNATSNSQQETPKSNAAGPTPSSLMARAVPQARKASLARFLEKRKERVCTNAPYQTKKPSEDSSHSDKASSPNYSSIPSVDGGKSQNMFIPKSEEKGSQQWQLEVKNEMKECRL